MRLVVKFFNDNSHLLEVEKSTTLYELKNLLCKKVKQEGDEHNLIILSKGGQLGSDDTRCRQLNDNSKTLGEYGISEESSVYLLLRLSGAGAKVEKFSSEDTVAPLTNPHINPYQRLGWHLVDDKCVYYYSLDQNPIWAGYDPQYNRYYVNHLNQKIWGPNPTRNPPPHQRNS